MSTRGPGRIGITDGNGITVYLFFLKTTAAAVVRRFPLDSGLF